MRRRIFLGTAGVAIAAGCLEDDTRMTGANDENGDEREGAETAAFPPGMNEDGIDDPERLTEAHAGAIDDTVYRYDESFSVTEETGGRRSESTTLIADPESERYRYEIERDGAAGEQTTEGFVDGDESVVRRNGAVEHDESGGASVIERPTEIPPEVFEALAFEYDETRTADSTMMLAFTATGYGDVFDDERVDPVGDPTGDLLVGGNGLLYEFEGTIVLADGDDEFEHDLEWSFTDVGTATVTEPEWIDDAPEPVETYDGFLDRVDGYDGAADATGRSEVTVEVGAGPDGVRFDSIAVIVDEGTTVVWEWVDEERRHDVRAVDGTFESHLSNDAEYAFRHAFDERGVYRYLCSRHSSRMRGVVEVV
ncbi:cupredoxin domain-containing protein [Natronococcus wangiae]|uniref:hypothetical protein n=1 Tax=Natronococcus wangiae TaxID=3068275 RepID=UPI00273E91E7|nr:hypothetical protein [Natronococcus sp. AD5]